MIRGKNTSRLRNSLLSFNLKFDVNDLLSKFHQIDHENTGVISEEEAENFLSSIGILEPSKFLSSQPNENYEFDHILSILGTIEQLDEPSLYVIKFVNLLANFKSERLKEDEENGLVSANEIDKKIKSIIKKEIERKITKIEHENQILIEELEINQAIQIKKFEIEWSNYINETESETKKKVHETIDFRNRSFYEKESKMAETSRRRYSVLTSKKLTELEEKKKKLVDESKYSEALLIKEKIAQEKEILKLKKENEAKFTASRRFESLNKKKDSLFETTIMLAHNNVKRIYKKKKDEEEIMKIRFNTLKKDTMKKLEEKLKNEIAKLKSMFYEAAKG